MFVELSRYAGLAVDMGLDALPKGQVLSEVLDGKWISIKELIREEKYWIGYEGREETDEVVCFDINVVVEREKWIQYRRHFVRFAFKGFVKVGHDDVLEA